MSIDFEIVDWFIEIGTTFVVSQLVIYVDDVFIKNKCFTRDKTKQKKNNNNNHPKKIQ